MIVERLSERVRTLEPIAARKAMEMAAERRAAGAEILSLYGSPHWLPPDHVLGAAAAAVRDNAGVPPEGLAALRVAMAERLGRENGFAVDAETQVLVTNAANHALYVIFTALLDPGDEVLTYSPHYYYQGIAHLAGGVPTYAPTDQADGWAWNAEALRAAVTPRTKVVVVNTPTNPTGYVATEDDLASVAELAVERDLLVVSDEAYDHTVYDGARHLSFAAIPGAAERTLTVISCTKSYAMRHWRMGFLVCPPELFTKLRDVLEWNCFQCNHVAQHAALAALAGPQDWIAEISRRFEHCRGLMTEQLDRATELSYSAPRGGPFIFLNVGALAVTPEEFHRRLLVDHGVSTDPGGPFGSEAHLRLPFGGEPEDVREAGARVAEAAASVGTA